MVSDQWDLACANVRTLLTHGTDGRTERNCSVTHCDDSCHDRVDNYTYVSERFGITATKICISRNAKWIRLYKILRTPYDGCVYVCVGINRLPQRPP
jgi:hypothetical protein